MLMELEFSCSPGVKGSWWASVAHGYTAVVQAMQLQVGRRCVCVQPVRQYTWWVWGCGCGFRWDFVVVVVVVFATLVRSGRFRVGCFSISLASSCAWEGIPSLGGSYNCRLCFE